MIPRYMLGHVEVNSIIRLSDGRLGVIKDPPGTPAGRREVNLRLCGGQVISLPVATEVELIKTPFQVAIEYLDAQPPVGPG
jgi:hypothetical protein